MLQGRSETSSQGYKHPSRHLGKCSHVAVSYSQWHSIDRADMPMTSQCEQHTTIAALQHLWQRLQSTHYPGVTSHLQAQDLSSQLRSSTAQESRTQRYLERGEKSSKSLNTAGVNARDKYSPSNKTLPLDTDDDKNGYNQRNSSHAGRHTTIETTMIVQ